MTSVWQRLDPRMLAVTPLRQLAGFLPVIAVVLLVGVGQDVGERFSGLLVGVLIEGYAKLSLKKWSPIAARNDDLEVFSGRR